VFRVLKMSAGVAVLGGVAAADVAADQALPQVNPGVAHLQTFFAAFAAGLNFSDFLHVSAHWWFCHMDFDAGRRYPDSN
jgi:hypothetical protein